MHALEWTLVIGSFIIGFLCGGSSLWKAIKFGIHNAFDKDYGDYHDWDE